MCFKFIGLFKNPNMELTVVFLFHSIMGSFKIKYDLARCWHDVIQHIWASLVGRLVKESNIDFKKAIRSINQGDAVPRGSLDR